ncbi:MAG: Asp-tRNA(Asn)/Glu-tRNA(Gln) amidotransferase GatCAB subunit A [Candidatus Rokuibacteriota bacterium]|nr:MAG: Asp-tRNA(Asn)/Glu-tRNA(Gln) amidotransferase GatCAB subunit A [Candidatus Rokubacteria bacterium]
MRGRIRWARFSIPHEVLTMDGTVASLAEAVRTKRVSPVELVRDCLARIERRNPALRAFITVDADGALATARALEAEAVGGRLRGPLHGVPVAHKDLCVVPGLPTSCGTRTLDYFHSDVPCTAAARLAAAGAILLGKLNMTELAMGPFGDNAHHGDVQNPWRAGHASGGSSSGSAAAVAAGLVAGAIGSDTGGSIRLPAACCGVVGLKPTYGRVSRAGVMPLSWTMDHIGPLAATVTDAALLFSLMAGHDAADPTSSPRPLDDVVGVLEGPVAGLRAAVPEAHFFDELSGDVEAAVRAAIGVLEKLGVRVGRATLPDLTSLTRECSTPIVAAEAATAHGRLLRERRDEVQPVVYARAAVGFSVSAVQYLEAQRLRERFAQEFAAAAFADADVLLMPTIPEPAPAYALAKAGSVEEIVARMGRFSRLTRPLNAAAVPALSVPCGFSADGRPLALQIVGRAFDEATVLRVGRAYERATDWRRPPP